MKRTIRLGTRESKLALAQSRWVADRIREKNPDIEIEIIGMTTKGDMILDQRLERVGGKGLFIKELEVALLQHKIDLAVHSMKDMPAEIPDELTLSAYTGSEDPRDVLVTRDKALLGDLKAGAVVGTSSSRREVQLLNQRPDLKVETLRGNVLTRLERLLEGKYDALILAAAGLKRLGLESKGTQFFNVHEMVPAVGQGVLAVQTRKNDEIESLVKCIHCEETALRMAAERAFMIKLNGGCTTPIAAHGVIQGNRIKIYGMLAAEDKSKIVKETIEGNKEDGALLGEQLAQILLDRL
ncbi:MAG: hydroxymethylbilane synthase [Clostridia bacterium]|nr:hydroxymethylbilane synthase [Clostridia bacterium]